MQQGFVSKTCGVYTITSPSGKQYVGQSSNIPRRWAKHKLMLSKGKHHCTHLQNAANKYGVDTLIFEVWALCKKEALHDFETEAGATLSPEYNKGAYGRSPMLGVRHSEEAKAKIAKAGKGRKHSAETVEKLRLRMLGYSPSEEVRAKMAANHKGMSGRRHTPETIARMREAQQVNLARPEVKLAISRGLLGKNFDEDRKQKLRDAKATPESRAKRIRYPEPVRCVETGEIFENAAHAGRMFGRKSQAVRKSADSGGIFSANGLHWVYVKGEAKCL